MTSKHRVIVEGYRKGLERALEALDETILLMEGKKPKKQRKRTQEVEEPQSQPMPTIYPDALGRPAVSARQMRDMPLSKLFPNKVFYLGKFPHLAQFGVAQGEVYIDGNVFRKLIAGKLRVSSKSAWNSCIRLLSNIFHVYDEPNHETNAPSIHCYTHSSNGRMWKIVIGLDGMNCNKITTIIDITGNELIQAKNLMER